MVLASVCTQYQVCILFRLVMRRETNGRKDIYTSENKNTPYGLFAFRGFWKKKFVDMVWRGSEFQVSIIFLLVRGSRTNQPTNWQTQIYERIKKTHYACVTCIFLIRCIKSLRNFSFARITMCLCICVVTVSHSLSKSKVIETWYLLHKSKNVYF